MTRVCLSVCAFIRLWVCDVAVQWSGFYYVYSNYLYTNNQRKVLKFRNPKAKETSRILNKVEAGDCCITEPAISLKRDNKSQRLQIITNKTLQNYGLSNGAKINHLRWPNTAITHHCAIYRVFGIYHNIYKFRYTHYIYNGINKKA